MTLPPFYRQFEDFWRQAIAQDRADLKRWLTGATCVFVALIGTADTILGTEVSLLVFYFVPISLAVVARGPAFGILIAVVCVAIWIAGDLSAGAQYPSALVPVWNGLIAFITYLVLIWLLAKLLAIHRELEERVRRRTVALANEVTARERLEKEILEISERERRSIGHDLHDGLGQHLTGTALTGQLLVEKLHDRSAEETPDARRIVALIKSAIEQTRQMAKGLLLADIDAEGLNTALDEFCSQVAGQFHIECTFHGEKQVALSENGVANHLYRIAQEAVRNSIRHGHARRIEVHLSATPPEIVLSVRDNGTGLPPPAARGAGLGLQIMEHRARIIAGVFAIETPPEGGTLVVCRLPLRPS